MPSTADGDSDIEIVTCGDDLLGVTTRSAADAQALAAVLRDSGDWRDAVGGIDTVVAQFDPIAVSLDDATSWTPPRSIRRRFR